MILKSLKNLAALVIFVLCTGQTHAQIAASLKITKKQHLVGEAVMAVVTITNHAGRELVFHSDGRLQWLDFIVKTANGKPVNPRARKLFGSMKIGAGQTLAREVDLSEHFHLTEMGNFSAVAVIRPPSEKLESTSTNRVFFNLSPGRPYWSQKVGVGGGSSRTREFKFVNFAGDSKSQIYAQVLDGQSGLPLRTFILGDVLMLRKPLATVDRQQRAHVMFLTTPTIWAHCVVDTDGNLISRNYHSRTSQGDPQLLTFGDGSVRITNSIPYDPKAAAAQKAKVRKATDRPPGT
jgi:hypothetical protein